MELAGQELNGALGDTAVELSELAIQFRDLQGRVQSLGPDPGLEMRLGFGVHPHHGIRGQGLKLILLDLEGRGLLRLGRQILSPSVQVRIRVKGGGSRGF